MFKNCRKGKSSDRSLELERKTVNQDLFDFYQCQKRHHKTIHYTERAQNQEVKNSTFEPLNTSAPDFELRFIDNCRSKVKKREPLTTSEVNDAETWLIKQDQSGINLSDPSDRFSRWVEAWPMEFITAKDVHVRITPFVFKDLETCTYAILRDDSIRGVLQPPYSGPYRILQRIGKVSVLRFGTKEVRVSIDRIKPA
ncbi:hypothetical protein TNIN_314801 [Trichonephila inaurata madagascariensis]|uniref:Uncharacterized protein n=1 Tax=Trichonephila inaurata madagascariensis TaxID=2747483 RepID=A0A8X7CNP5_9ARAC|nr:hypothetical protein TNIN_314801 [Trichonephila inaurata madagascariensis]